MLLLSLFTASAGTLGVSAAAPALLYVDGKPVNVAVGDRPVWVELPGTASHIVEARTSSDRPITSLDVVVPDGFEVVVEYRDRHFGVTGIAAVAPRAAPPVAAPPVRTGPVVVAVLPPAALPPIATGPAPAALGPVPVEFRSVDGEWADLYVDGEKRAEYRVNSPAVVLSLTPGAHKVEIRDFMGSETWDTGHLMVVGGGTMKVGFGKKSGVEVYTAPQAWTD